MGANHYVSMGQNEGNSELHRKDGNILNDMVRYCLSNLQKNRGIINSVHEAKASKHDRMDSFRYYFEFREGASNTKAGLFYTN